MFDFTDIKELKEQKQELRWLEINNEDNVS